MTSFTAFNLNLLLSIQSTIKYLELDIFKLVIFCIFIYLYHKPAFPISPQLYTIGPLHYRNKVVLSLLPLISCDFE